ncbi:MAG: FAD-dependent oxidoreductase [Anaerolineae bacterium]
MSDDKKVGAALVVGGGIAGMQAALDLAGSGIKVYLVDKKPAIGGTMAQLDKTFPTNDCAMCTMAPRLVDVARHLNIELVTYSTVENVTGEAGNFKVKIRNLRRFVDLEKCTGCGECENACPVEVKDEFNLGLSNRKAIYRLYPQAIPNVFTIDKLDEKSPCKVACPARVNAQAYVKLISQKKFSEALAIIRERNPFPAICGRVCHHPCEEECNRKDVDEAIAIRGLKRFAIDHAMQNGEEAPEPVAPTKGEKVAVIGAGPAGLTCALRLVEMGYPTTVIDASAEPGGMMTACIPNYRIPKSIARYDINRILAHGVTLRVNTKVGKDVTLDELRGQFNAIFVAIGAQDAAKLPVEGAESQGVLFGLPFLREAKGNGKVENFGESPIIIGGGNVGIDCAKTALRLGAKEVHLVCLETRDLASKDRMPAHNWEIEEAEEEGVVIHPCLGPKKIVIDNGRVTGLETIACTSVYDDSGKFAPKFDKDSPSPTIPGDTVIIAIGQRSDLSGFEQLEQERRLIKVDPITLQTSIPGIFAGGDIVSGPASVVEAVQHGNEAAISIDRYLRGENLREGRGLEEPKITQVREEVKKEARQNMPKLSASERKTTFSEIELGFTEEMAVSEANRCLSCSICAECLQCVKACKAEAIDHQMQERVLELDVGAVILAAGYEIVDPEAKKELGYGRYPNVISSLQFERLLSASGPHMGKVLRPSDLKTPKKVAFIQCVGSREIEHNYCSSVCCMYATKEAIIVKEHEPDTDCTIFYIDLRAFGKGFEAYYNRAKELGIRYIRCRPSSIKEVPQTRNLLIQYQKEGGQIATEDFDLVVLSVGLRPIPEGAELARVFGIDLNEHGFASTKEFSPTESSRQGVYVAGLFSGPKDIPESVMEASAAASKVMGFLAEERGSLIAEKTYPPERDVSGQEPRIGVFICHCGRNIAGVVNISELVEYARTLPNVSYVEDNLYTCSTDTQQVITQKIQEHDLNRVIVASCTPRTHEPLFQDTLREAGLNPYLFEMANIRDQCSWVHMHEPEAATEKAKDLVRMAVAKARLLEPLYPQFVDVIPRALVIGGGMAGMTAALDLAEQGFETYLLEKSLTLGGNVRRLKFLMNGDDPQEWLDTLIQKVTTHPKVQVYTEAEISDFQGSIGNFKTEFIANGKVHSVEHGVVIVATGAQEYRPQEYMYGQDPRVMTQLELEEKLTNGDFKAGSVVMVQCVGSCEEPQGYCSRLCCSQAVKNALKMKEGKQQADVFILHRDVRTYGFNEAYYRKAREAGVRFIRFEQGHEPEVTSANGHLAVSVDDSLLGMRLSINCDAVVLAAGIVPRDDNSDLAQKLKIPLTQDGFFLEAHMKLRPVDFASDGIFLCGLAHAPKSLTESIVQASAAAARAATVLSKRQIELEPKISQVVDENCDGCAYCIEPCPYDAITLIEYMKEGAVKKTVESDPAKCRGCGVCQATCPKKGIFVRNFRLEQISAMVEAALTR